ncbi:initiation factor 2B [Marinobacter lutaoensis]|nr:initiation factor 2B [Marinobacter lutaoensis]|tara:strand:- start:2182 stop:3060 length:879 start_codon:yes stop_codon:yes gene_type:complete
MEAQTMDANADALLRKLRDDHQSGAAQLALSALDGLAQWLDTGPVRAADWQRMVSALARARPSMVPLGNAMQRCREGLAGPADAADIRPSARAVVASVRADLVEAGERVAQHAASQVPEGARVLTHSRSSQVLALFRLLVRRGQRCSVICTQGSPGNEGFVLARELDALGLEVTVVTDAQMGLVMADADLVLSGCDTWLADRHFVNKAGTYLLALAAQDQGKPLWVLADHFKDSPATRDTVTLETMAGAELGAPTGTHIRPRNVYFETIPTRLITGRISERGVFSCPAEARR